MIIFILLVFVLILYSLFSYILTEPNLVLSSNPLYWNFQLKIWDNFYHNSKFITSSYILLIVCLFVLYIWVISILKNRKVEFKLSFKSIYLWAYAAIILPLLLSYNALSHDIFNYVFNARMVLKWGYNPHIKSAIDFVQIDDWTRFMHNIHTTAPYGYGWTVLSLIPSYLGFEKLLATLFSFKLLMLLSMLFLYFALQHLSKTLNKRSLYLYELALVFLNPLLLIEVVSNYHNDLWMMAPAVLAVSMILRLMQPELLKRDLRKKVLYFLMACVLLLFSVSIKLVTVVLVPLFIFAFAFVFFLDKYSSLIKKRFNIPIPQQFISTGLLFISTWIEKYIPSIIAFMLFIPLLTQRSQQFLPWYFLWILVWVPFIKNKTFKMVILLFSISSLLRYVPWLNNSFEYTDEVQLQSRVITWIIPILYIFTNIKDATKNIKKIGRM